MRVLFLVNGVGLGNATRCHAVIQRLHAAGDRVALATSGNGAWYFDGRAEIDALHTLEPLAYAARDGDLAVGATLARAGGLLRTIARNDAQIARIADTFRPHVVVADSVYSLWGVHRRRIPVLALNNADGVAEGWRRFTDRPAGLAAHYRLVETPDRWFQRWFARRVVSPTLDPSRGAPPAHVLRVGPIVRQGLPQHPRAGRPRRAVVVLSGSGLGGEVRLTRAPPVPVDVVGREAPEGPAVPGVTWHGRVKDDLALLAGADIAVVQGGFSAVSELVWHGVPLLVLPIGGHAEQWVNARTVAALGVGAITSAARWEADLHAALADPAILPRWQAARRALGVLPDGADAAAAAVRALPEASRR
jgi:UDP:flavonoid glycosyltransferase YjiC (YdhE family)